MKQNRITTEQDLGVSPHSGNPLVMGSTGNLKVLNLYAGIGGNRKLWEDVDVTAVEYDERIAAIYKDHFPNDNVIVGDAHDFLRKHYADYDFIWASPPCPTHSRFNFLNNPMKDEIEYPDMTLYQEIILLQTWFKGKFCVENVISYYEPLIKPIESNNHYFWTNFNFRKEANTKRGIRGEEMEFRKERMGYDLSKYNLKRDFEKKILNNCTEAELGLHILDCARGIIRQSKNSQASLFDGW
jgi:DNA (cytosine-5)-methyltransferase 1